MHLTFITRAGGTCRGSATFKMEFLLAVKKKVFHGTMDSNFPGYLCETRASKGRVPDLSGQIPIGGLRSGDGFVFFIEGLGTSHGIPVWPINPTNGASGGALSWSVVLTDASHGHSVFTSTSNFDQGTVPGHIKLDVTVTCVSGC